MTESLKPLEAGDVRTRVEELVPDLGTVSRVVPLTGGLLNCVWRVEAVHGTAIAKHAPPFVAANPEIALSPERIHFEARALELFGAGGSLERLVQETSVAVPALLAFVPGEFLLVEQDFGAGADFAASPSDPGTTDTFTYAAALGEFIHALHQVSAEHPDYAGCFDNKSVQRTRKAVQYDAVSDALEAAGIPRAAEAGAYAGELGDALLNPGICLVMGDLWPRSILPRDEMLGVIDWEFAHYGRPAQDIGHLGAHLWMLHQYDDSERYRRAWDAFRRPWLNIGEDDEVRVHFGCEIVARTVGAFGDSYLFSEDRDGARLAAERAMELIVGERNLHTIWDAG